MENIIHLTADFGWLLVLIFSASLVVPALVVALEVTRENRP